MKDIDFDELDRAIGSLNMKAAESTPAQPVEKTVDLTSATPTAAPVWGNGASSTVSAPSERAPGRFMDVVRPVGAKPNQPAGRPPSARAAVPFAGTPVVNPASVETVSPITPPADSESDIVEGAAPVAAQLNNGAMTEADDTTAAPLESPFLTDAKVEKRPLGAFSEAAQPAALAAESGSELQSFNDALANELAKASDTEMDPGEATVDIATAPEQSSADVPDADAQIAPRAEEQLPEELQEDVLRIESSEELVAEVPVTPGADEAAEASTFEENVPEIAVPAGGSISQQYKETASDDAERNAIYDTDAYHQPLKQVAPKKKKTPLLVTLFIFIGILVGVGIGAVFYFFVV